MDVVSTFDYAVLDGARRATVEECRDDIRCRGRRMADDIIGIGKALRTAKALLPHGQFGPWLKAEFDWSQPTARRYMQVAEVFPEIAHAERFESTALYLLAAKTTPDEIREEFIAQAGAGHAIKAADVKHAVNRQVDARERRESREKTRAQNKARSWNEVSETLTATQDAERPALKRSDGTDIMFADVPGRCVRWTEDTYDEVLPLVNHAVDVLRRTREEFGPELWSDTHVVWKDVRAKREELVALAEIILDLCQTV